MRGSWLACTAARTSAGEAPDTPMGSAPLEALPAKAKPRMAAMASGATRHVMTTERSRTRRRSSLRVMTTGQAPRSSDPGVMTRTGKKLALAVVITLEPVGFVVGGRVETIDDDWGEVEAVIRLDGGAVRRPTRWPGSTTFSHLVVVFQFHLVDPSRRAVRAPATPGGTRSGPRWACSPSGPRCGPTVSACPPARWLGVEGLDLHVRGLDAVDGSPVLDVKPYMREFEPDGRGRPPAGLGHRADARVLLIPGPHDGPGLRGEAGWPTSTPA